MENIISINQLIWQPFTSDNFFLKQCVFSDIKKQSWISIRLVIFKSKSQSLTTYTWNLIKPYSNLYLALNLYCNRNNNMPHVFSDFKKKKLNVNKISDFKHMITLPGPHSSQVFYKKQSVRESN